MVASLTSASLDFDGSRVEVLGTKAASADAPVALEYSLDLEFAPTPASFDASFAASSALDSSQAVSGSQIATALADLRDLQQDGLSVAWPHEPRTESVTEHSRTEPVQQHVGRDNGLGGLDGRCDRGGSWADALCDLAGLQDPGAL